MAFFQPRFFGLTVRDFKTSLGQGGQASSLSIQLVADPLVGDVADPAPVGTPCYFQFYGFRFSGLLQRFTKSNGVDGLPTYDATLVDPREILDGAQITTGGYAGSTMGVANWFNAYGYWENQGFGQSGSTPAGMPWDKVVQAVRLMANSPSASKYGGPLTFRGVSYGLDLSQLPSPPGYYRLPTPNISLMELVSQICEDSGCDFFVELVGLTIRVRTISRFFQPPLGTISALALSSTYSGSTIRTEAGVEIRNEVTSAILTGGEKTALHITTDAASYWGTDVLGNPVVGEVGTFEDFGACEYANLNAGDCADIVGSTTYRCSTIEMRFALWGREAWDTFIDNRRPEIAQLVGGGLYAKQVPFAPDLQNDLVGDSAAVVNRAVNDALADRRGRLFDLVQHYANDFYGKQYLVKIPFVQAKVDEETGQQTTTMEPAQSGYLEFGAAALGVPANRLDVLQDADERVFPFAYYADITDTDTSRISFGEAAVDASGKMWSKIQVSPRIMFLPGATPTPCVHVRLGGSLYDRPADEFGDITDAGRAFGPNQEVSDTDLGRVNDNAFGGTIGHLGIHPPTRVPTAFGIALKSNVEVYGPWVIAGAPGKVRVEQDPGLTPWDYGGEAVMNLAGNARVLTAVTNQQVSESGSVTHAGAPAWSLGDVLQTGGPNLTNIEVSFGQQGVTTSYRWQTFTPRFGLFSRQNSERVRRLAASQVEARRQFRKALNKALVASATIDKAARGAKANRAFYAKKQSPHTVLMAQGLTSGSNTRQASGLETYEAALSLLGQGGNYPDKAIMSLNGLVRGFSTNPSSTGKLPKYLAAGGAGITRADLDPFQAGNDIEVLAWGQTYAGAHAYHRGNTPGDTRAIALRGPLVIAGPAPGVDGKKYPSDGATGYVNNYLRRSDLWPVGPVDHLWDPKRGVFTSHDILDGQFTANVAPGATGTFRVGNDPNWTITVRNRWSDTITGNSHALIGYVVNKNEWQIIAVDCVP